MAASEWADIDIFVGGLAVGLLIGGLFTFWAIRAFMAGVREGFEKRLREDQDRLSKHGVPGRCDTCCHLAGQRIGAGDGKKCCGCECHEPNRPTVTP